jgi:MFS family permease
MLTVLLIGQFMAMLDITIVNVAMPTMGTDLHASGAALQLIVSGYTISYAMLLITCARLGELLGHRRLFWLGVMGFTASSLLCGLAPNALTLIIARFIQGAAAAVMMPQNFTVHASYQRRCRFRSSLEAARPYPGRLRPSRRPQAVIQRLRPLWIFACAA